MNERMITQNEIFAARTQGMGVLTGDEAIALGVTGPNLRASGVPFDVRKAHPVLDLQRARVRRHHPARAATRTRGTCSASPRSSRAST